MKKIGLCLTALMLTIGLFAQTTDQVRRSADADFTVIALAQQCKGQTPDQIALQVTDKLTNKLNLNEEQRKALHLINVDSAEKMHEIAKVHKGNQAKIDAKHYSLYLNSTAKVLRLLDTEQQKLYRLIMAKTKPLNEEQRRKIEMGKRM